ncbi:MAG: winged helix-turn-helix domain-containing protein [Candidatus Asgardarchaeia archaeon]
MGIFTDVFGSTIRVRLIEYFLEHPDSIIYLTELSRVLGVSHSSVSRVIQPLIDMNLIEEIPLAGRLRFFRLNLNSRIAKFLLSFYKTLDKKAVKI